MPLPKNAKRGGRPTLANLNRVLPWQSVRQALEIAGTSNGLPETVACPLCRGALTAYPLGENVWLHCDGCRWTGDGLDLACQVWGLDAPAALKRFEAIGYPISASYLNQGRAEQYERVVRTRRRECQEFLARAAAFPPWDSRTLRQMHEQLGLPSYKDTQRWSKQLAVFSAVLPGAIRS